MRARIDEHGNLLIDAEKFEDIFPLVKWSEIATLDKIIVRDLNCIRITERVGDPNGTQKYLAKRSG